MEVRISSSGSSRKEGSSNSSNRRAVGSSRQGSDQAATPANSMKEDMVVVNEEKGIFGMVDLMRAAAEVLGNGSLGSAYNVIEFLQFPGILLFDCLLLREFIRIEDLYLKRGK